MNPDMYNVHVNIIWKNFSGWKDLFMHIIQPETVYAHIQVYMYMYMCRGVFI